MRRTTSFAVTSAAFVTLAGFAVLGTSCVQGEPRPCAKTPSAAEPWKDDGRPRVVMISIDGLRPEYLRDPDTYGLRVPNLRKLRDEGSMAEGVTSVFPTVTYPAHTTLVTGVRPSRHGIVNNGPFDPFAKNQGGWYWYASDIRVRTLWDAAREKGLTTAQSYWPVTVGATFDWSFPQIWRAKNDEDDKLLWVLATPGVRDEVRARYGALPTEHRSDKERADAAELVLETRRPHLSFVYLTDLDTEQHASGPFSKPALEVLEKIDAHVGRVVAATERGGTRARTSFVVVSDHGFLAIHSLVHPGVLLRKAGLIDLDGNGQITAYRAQIWKAGGTCAVMLRDPKDDVTRKMVREIFDSVAGNPAQGIAKVHDGASVAKAGGFPEAALVLEAATGFAFGTALDGALVGPSGDKGAHGYPPTRTEMRAALVVSGAGLKKGVPLGIVDMLDVAPTVARILGLSLPEAEGKPIDAVLTGP